MANIDKLRYELQNDPLGIGYNSMSDIEVAQSLNTKNRVFYKQTTNMYLKDKLSSIFCSDGRNLCLYFEDIEKDTAHPGNLIARSINYYLNNFVDIYTHKEDIRNRMEMILNMAEVTFDEITGEHTSFIRELWTTTKTRAEELDILGNSLNIGPAHVSIARGNE